MHRNSKINSIKKHYDFSLTNLLMVCIIFFLKVISIIIRVNNAARSKRVSGIIPDNVNFNSVIFYIIIKNIAILQCSVIFKY